MFVIKCFWAGHLVSSFKANDDKEIDEKLEDLKQQLTSKDMTFVSCKHTFVLGELCVDVMNGVELFATYNLKA